MRGFVSRLGDGQWEVIPRTSRLGGEPGACFHNVLKTIKNEGGEALLGWAVRVWLRAFIEAEQHVIWRQESNDLLDVTPHASGKENWTFFVRDDQALFSDEGLATRINQYECIAVGKHKSKVMKLIRAARKRQMFFLENTKIIDGEPLLFADDKLAQQLQGDMNTAFLEVKRKIK